MTRLRIALVVLAAIIVAHALWLAIADPADADDSGIVTTCQSVAVWDAYNLGDVTVTRTGGTDLHRPGNALTVPYVTAAGPVVRVTTAHHTYVVAAPAGCTTTTVSPSTTTSQSSTTTTATVPPTTVPPGTFPPVVPSSTTPPPSPASPPPATVGAPTPTTTLPPAPPAEPVVEQPAFTG